MLKDERLKYIEDYVNQHKRVPYQELMNQLQISKATVRRDLELLNSENRVILVRGGAIAKKTTANFELPYNMKLEVNSAEKLRIAEAAAQMVQAGNTIVLDSGTTTKHMIPFLAQLPYVNIITCDVIIAASCSYYPNIETTVIGGKLRSGYYNLYGYIAENVIQTLSADIAFCSIDAISKTNDCMITNIEEVSIKQKIRSCASRRVMLCDHTKIGCNAVVKVYDIDGFDKIICGRELSQEVLSDFNSLKERIVLV